MAKRCPSITDPVHCVRCRSIAQELLKTGELNEDERARVKQLLLHLRGDNPLEDEGWNFLNDLAARYLE